MTLDQIRKRLGEIAQGPRWFFSRDLEYLDCAIEAGLDPDRWEDLSTDSKGLLLARHRARGTMRAWEDYQANRKRS